MAGRMRGDVRVDAARRRRVACLGSEHDRTRAEVGRAVQDLRGDVGVRAVAVHELAGDGHAGFAELGEAGLEQGFTVCGALEVGGVLAGEHIRLDHVQDVDRGAARAGQRRSERAHLA